MKYFGTYFLLLVGFVGGAVADPNHAEPMEAPSAQAVCNDVYRIISLQTGYPRRHGVQEDIDVLVKALERKRAAQIAVGLDQAGGHVPAERNVSDGQVRDLHVGSGDRPQWIDTDQFDELIERANALKKKLSTSGDREQPLGFFSITEIDDITNLLEKGQRAKSDDQKEEERRAIRNFGFNCLIGGVGVGAIGGLTWAIARNPNRALDEEIVKNAQQTTATTKEKHLELVEAGLEGFPDKEDVLAEHKKEIAMMESLGLPIEYGARFSEYQFEYGEQIARLKAMLKRSPFNSLSVETLEREYRMYDPRRSFDRSEFVFEDRELFKRYLNGASQGAQVLSSVGAIVGAAGTSGALAMAACRKAGGVVTWSKDKIKKLQNQRGFEPIPRLKPFLDGAKQAKKAAKSGALNSQEVHWLGASTLNGQQAELFLIVDNSNYPPRVTLSGLGFNDKFDFHKPPPKPKKGAEEGEEGDEEPERRLTWPPPLAKERVDLSKLELDILTSRFANTFGGEIDRVKEVFNAAKALKLNEPETEELVNLLSKVSSIEDLKPVDELLGKFRMRRRGK